MAALRGERFHVPLSDEDPSPQEQQQETSISAPDILGDIAERTPSAPSPPTPGVQKSGISSTGWPALRKRYDRKKPAAAGIERGEAASSTDPSNASAIPMPYEELERQQIDKENKQKLAEMSPEEIERERQELFAGMSPALIEKLLKRATIDDQPQHNPPKPSIVNPQTPAAERPSQHRRNVSFALPEQDENVSTAPSAESHSLPISPPAPPPVEPSSPQERPGVSRLSGSGRRVSFANLAPEAEDKQSTAESHSVPPTPPPAPISDTHLSDPPAMHFPTPPVAPDLDPNSETFLDDLHTKYFPNLSHDPSKLDWMKPSTAEENASYDPAQEALSPKDIRFSFKGQIIPPSLSMSLPTDIGLHHHGDAPDAAGYTIPELAHLARSTYPGQRCIAIQTLGRILYRLGKGEFGNENDIDVHGHDGDGERALLAKGLWEVVEERRVIDTITEEAKKERGHRTSIALAQEAAWNWQRGGGRQRMAV